MIAIKITLHAVLIIIMRRRRLCGDVKSLYHALLSPTTLTIFSFFLSLFAYLTLL